VMQPTMPINQRESVLWSLQQEKLIPCWNLVAALNRGGVLVYGERDDFHVARKNLAHQRFV
jgi:hypothetical protein